jgi:hypothetical protein
VRAIDLIRKATLKRESFDEAAQAEKVAKKLLAAGSFADLAEELHIIAYSQEEVGDDDWVGQYVAGSIDSEHGLTVLVAPDAHEGVNDMVDTILHECGHALWELIDDEPRAAWGSDVEAFADNLMAHCIGDFLSMDRQELWQQLTAPAQE